MSRNKLIDRLAKAMRDLAKNPDRFDQFQLVEDLARIATRNDDIDLGPLLTWARGDCYTGPKYADVCKQAVYL